MDLSQTYAGNIKKHFFLQIMQAVTKLMLEILKHFFLQIMQTVTLQLSLRRKRNLHLRTELSKCGLS